MSDCDNPDSHEGSGVAGVDAMPDAGIYRMNVYLLNMAFCYLVYGFVIAPIVGTIVQHCAYYVAAVAMQIAYFSVHTISPGEVPKRSAKARKLYAEALQAAADGTYMYADASCMPALCHTCQIVKPMRSKHCTVLKRCVPMFDHYCPYLNNTIGGANYLSFMRFSFLGLVSSFLSVAGAVQYLLNVTMFNQLVWFYLVDMSMVLLTAISMNGYHITLILKNLTTNEDMNKHRYTYLRRDMKKIYNPFSRGPWGNVCEFIGRREAVLDDPYVHSELYKVLRLKDDIERCGRCR